MKSKSNITYKFKLGTQNKVVKLVRVQSHQILFQKAID